MANDRPTRSSSSSPRRARVTIRDVARAAGVSVGTVSKALNGTGSLRDETRQRIIDTAQRLGFRPNDLAQSLHRDHSFTVGLISNDNFGRFTLPIMQGLEAVLAEEGFVVFMANATDSLDKERRSVDRFLAKRVDGLVFTSRRSDERPAADVHDVPTIYVFTQSQDPDSFSLLPDDEGGAVLAVEHLVETGKRRIAHVTGPERFEAVELRRKGYRSTLDARGLPFDERLCLLGEWSGRWGREAVARLFDGPDDPPDGIFCGNDQIARGVIDALKSRGLSVPDDVAVVGFDNWSVITEESDPTITSIDMNLDELGREAGRHLLDMIRGDAFHGVLRLPCTLVRRSSS